MGKQQRRLTRGVAVACVTGAWIAAWVIAPTALPGAASARADEHLTLVKTISVGGKGLGAFDISYVNPDNSLYVLSDRTNASVDMFDPSTDTFLGRVGGFKGVVLNANGTANNGLSGPDGVVIVGNKEIWAGDGDSTMKVIDIASQKITHVISTGGQFRVDEMAWDPRDHLVAAANNADTPPFLSIFDTRTHKVIAKIVFDGSNGTPNATNGLEQSKWSPETGMFYVSVPQVGATATDGGMSVIDPHKMQVVATYLVENCSPAGLALGPRRQALLGCSASYGTSPNILTQSVVIDIANGDIKANVTQVGGSDEVWYDRGTNHYYLGARSDQTATGTPTPVLGSIDAATDMFDASVSTSTTAHSVAAADRHVFVPIGFVPPTAPAGTDPTNPCPQTGCIAVYKPSGRDDDDRSGRDIAADIDQFLHEHH